MFGRDPLGRGLSGDRTEVQLSMYSLTKMLYIIKRESRVTYMCVRVSLPARPHYYMWWPSVGINENHAIKRRPDWDLRSGQITQDPRRKKREEQQKQKDGQK